MEFLFFIIMLGLLLFGIPELIRRSNKQKYEYPEIPNSQMEMHRPSSPRAKRVDDNDPEGVSLEWENQNTGVRFAAPEMVDVITKNVESNSWNGQLTLPFVVNGVIFAEILQPPRAKRPLAYRWRK